MSGGTMTVTEPEAPVVAVPPVPATPAAQPVNPAAPSAQPASPEGGVDLFSDARSGFWAGVTGFFCVAIVAAGNLVLLAAAIGQEGFRPARWSLLHAAIWGGVGGVSVGGVVALLYLIAWQSAVSDGKESFAWQPVVGFTMSVVAVASFGGYYLASRRCRV